MVGIDSILGIGEKIIDKLWPDPQKKAEAKVKLMEMRQRGELAVLEQEVKLMLAQVEVNKVEAQSERLFKSGWRPAIGWICAIAVGYSFVLQPILSWASGLFGGSPAPTVDTQALYPLMMGMLGLGGMRSFDKKKIIDKK